MDAEEKLVYFYFNFSLFYAYTLTKSIYIYIRDQKDQRGLTNLKITHKRAGNKKGYRMVLNGNIKGYQRTRCNQG
jgi:hypothetical protein